MHNAYSICCHLRDFVHHLLLLHDVLHDHHDNHLLGYLGRVLASFEWLVKRALKVTVGTRRRSLSRQANLLVDWSALVYHEQKHKALPTSPLHWRPPWQSRQPTSLCYHLGDLFHHLPLLDVLHDQLVKHLLLDVLHDQLVKHLLLDALHDHLVMHPLLDVLHDHLVKHLLLPILDVLHEL